MAIPKIYVFADYFVPIFIHNLLGTLMNIFVQGPIYCKSVSPSDSNQYFIAY